MFKKVAGTVKKRKSNSMLILLVRTVTFYHY